MQKRVFFRSDTAELCSLADAQSICPDVALTMTDEELLTRGFHRVEFVEPPACGPYQQVDEVTPELVDGRYVRRYLVRDLFTVDTVGFDGKVTTIRQQQALFDIGRLKERRAALLQIAQDARQAAYREGVEVQLGTDERGVVDLQPETVQQLLLERAGPHNGDRRDLLTRSGLKSVGSAYFEQAFQEVRQRIRFIEETHASNMGHIASSIDSELADLEAVAAHG